MFKREQRGPWIVAGIFAFFAVMMAGTGVALAITANQATVDCPVTSVSTVGTDGNFSVTVQCHLSLPSTEPTPQPTATPTPTPTPTATATPTPTPTPTATSPTPTPTPTPPSTNCVASPHLCGFPDATNTGVPAGTKLTVVTGNQVYSTPGQVISGMDIRGCVSIRADNVTIKNSRITCTTSDAGVKTHEGACGGNNYCNRKGILIQDVEIDGGGVSNNGLQYGGFDLLRVNIHGFENGIAWSAEPGSVRDSYIHGLNCTADSNGNCTGGQHPDGMQFSAGQTDVTIDHNTIIAPITNSAIIMYDATGDQNARVVINNNILSGGGFTLYCNNNPSTGNRVTNNRFGASRFGPRTSGCSVSNGDLAAWSGNVSDATGQPIPAA